MVVIEK